MSKIDQHAKSPDVRCAYKAAVAYIERTHTLNALHSPIGSELKRRIKRLENDCNKLVRINNHLVDAGSVRADFDQESGTITFSGKGYSKSFQIPRANPDVPVKIAGSSSTHVYVPGREDSSGEADGVDPLKMQMEQMLEGYYYNAFRITKLVQQLTGRKKDHCPAITAIRNELIEHPKQIGETYSFGYGSNGPVIKPWRLSGSTRWNDSGLVPNTCALVNWLTQAFTARKTATRLSSGQD